VLPRLFVFSLILLASTPQARTGRLRPPDTLGCDRNKLTAFSGIVTQWSRDDSRAHLNMNTDADTKEAFEVRFEKGKPSEQWFLIGGELFRTSDWNRVEIERGRLKPGMQATVWVCEGSANPVIDWRLPPK